MMTLEETAFQLRKFVTAEEGPVRDAYDGGEW
jgi:hypothetical protein